MYPDQSGPQQPGYPYAGYQPADTHASKPRPGLKWVWLGAAAIVIAIVVPLIVALTVVLPQFSLDEQEVPVDGSRHALVLPANAEYGLYVSDSAGLTPPSCVFASASGESIPLALQSGTVTVNGRHLTHHFRTGDGRILVSCEGGQSQNVSIGKVPSMGLIFGGIFGSLGFALLFLILGTVAIIVTLVRRRR